MRYRLIMEYGTAAAALSLCAVLRLAVPDKETWTLLVMEGEVDDRPNAV